MIVIPIVFLALGRSFNRPNCGISTRKNPHAAHA
jgi:hypothetical protein